MTKKIFHVAMPQDWAAAQETGAYHHPSLVDEGFIHCSFEDQVAGVLERYYVGVPQIVLLQIDPDRLTAPLKIEFATSVNQDFPHIFGTINLAAVLSAELVTLPVSA